MAYRPPGRLSPRISPDLVMMICTAGHVDHGKTRLVGLLTGCQTDRLKTEQERGLTIELGFAPCYLGGDTAVGIVDVPGHEKFVKNMVAGVSGIGMALLVVAADDGIMPQTVEHFQILDLLGVREGMVALTKTDLVAPERVEARRREIREFLHGTWLGDAPICPVSAETFEGYAEFYDTLVKKIEVLARRPRPGVFRMPVERTFNRPGFGVVITGIPVEGKVRVGDRLELAPTGETGRVRGIQRFLRDTDEGAWGQCLAINAPDLAKNEVRRGQVLAAPGMLRGARIFHLDMQTVAPLERPLENAEQVKLHTGTSEEPGTLYLLDGKTLEGAQRGFATVVLHEDLAAAPFDRFIVRRASPAATVAGGRIAAVTLGSRRPRRAKVLERLEAFRLAFDDVDPSSQEGVTRRVGFALDWDAPQGASRGDLSRATLLDAESVGRALHALEAAGRVVALSEDCYIAPHIYEAVRTRVEDRVVRAEKAGTLNLTTRDLRGEDSWPAPLWGRVVEDLIGAGKVTRRGDRYLVRGAVAEMPDADRDLMERIAALYLETAFQSPRPDEVPAKLGASSRDVDRLMRHLFTEGRLIRLDKNVALHYDVYRRAQELLVREIQEHGVVRSGEFKNLLGTSRKYAINLLDFMDARHITVRDGNDRKLAAGYEKNLL